MWLLPVERVATDERVWYSFPSKAPVRSRAFPNNAHFRDWIDKTSIYTFEDVIVWIFHTVSLSLLTNQFHFQLSPPISLHPILSLASYVFEYCTNRNIVAGDAALKVRFLNLVVAIASSANQSCKACSSWVFATVEKVFQWNNLAWSDAISADSDRWGPLDSL